jgi:hypothetical protein
MATTRFLALWIEVLKELETLSQSFDRIWRKRRRLLGTRELALTILKVVSLRGAASASTALSEIWDKMGHCGSPAAQSSLCEARQKLPSDFFRILHARIIRRFERAFGKGPRWRGRRVFAVDASRISLPRELIRDGFFLPSQSHYPHGLVSCLYRLDIHLPYDVELGKENDERAAARAHLAVLKARDVVVYDRGYFSYTLIAEHRACGIDCVCR